MDIRWFQDFLTVAEVGNFTKASELRNASQAAFSRRIQSLEIWLGVTLIDRSVFPTRLTSEGERFREDAVEIVRQVLDARTGLKGPSVARPDHIRIALPHTLAIGRLPGWWARWSEGRAINLHIEVGNVHDMVTSLISSEVDLFVGFHHAQQPIHLDPELYDRLEIGQERLRPYVAASNVGRWTLPGTSAAPLPLVMYAPGSYLGRMVDLVISGAPTPILGGQVFSCDMADVIRRMVAAGYGIGWLPDCSAEVARGDIVALDDDRWTMTLSIVAHRDRSKRRASVDRLWASIAEHQD
jgi:DNA-binding transcriptional LysR family regulator